MSVFPIVQPKFRAFDSNGDPLAGGLLYSYAAGTTTPLDTYTTRAGTVANANPVVLDANGEADVWLTGGVEYKFALKDSTGVTQWTVDNVPATSDLVMPLGNVSAPGLAFTGDPNTGFYRPTADQVGVAAGGVQAALFTATASTLKASGNTIVEATTLAKLSASVAATATDPTNAAELTNGHLKLSAASPNKDEGFTSTLTPKNVVKAWARVQSDGLGAYTIVDGFNVASIASSATDRMELNLVTGVADTTKAIVMVSMIGPPPGAATIAVYRATWVSATQIRISGLLINIGPSVGQINFSTSANDIAVLVLGDQ